jgi:autotransporter passenger strand-loop-strand repeat protein
MTTKIISSGVTSSGLTVNNGVELVVRSGGVASSTTVLQGGEMMPASGAVVDNVTVNFGGWLAGGGDVTGAVNISGVANGVTVVGVAGDVTISSAGESINVTVDSGSNEAVVSGGYLTGGTVRSAGVLQIYAGAHASGGVIDGGGTLTLLSGAIASETVESGGTLSFGEALVVNSGQTFVDRASISSTTLLDGVTLSSGALLHVSSATVLSGGHLSLTAGASVTSATVSGGALSLALGAPAAEITVLNGGALSGPGQVNGVDDFGGSVSGVSVGSSLFSSGAALNVGSEDGFYAGTASGDVVVSGGLEIVNEEGIANGETVRAGGTLDVVGVVSATTVSGSGILAILGGDNGPHLAEATVLLSNSYEYVYGTTSGTVVSYGGHENIGVFGVAHGSMIESGGWAAVSSIGGAVSATVLSGGVMYVLSYGDAYATTVSGGELVVSANGILGGGLTIHGGTAIISGTVSSDQTVSFTGSSGLLDLENLAGFQANISGLLLPSQKVDLGGFAFFSGETVSWAQSGTSGTLTVTDRTKTAQLTLIGVYVQGDFHLATDGSSGTFVTDPRPLASAEVTGRGAAGFAQAIAGFRVGDSMWGLAAIHSGGAAVMSAPLMTDASSGR